MSPHQEKGVSARQGANALLASLYKRHGDRGNPMGVTVARSRAGKDLRRVPDSAHTVAVRTIASGRRVPATAARYAGQRPLGRGGNPPVHPLAPRSPRGPHPRRTARERPQPARFSHGGTCGDPAGRSKPESPPRQRTAAATTRRARASHAGRIRGDRKTRPRGGIEHGGVFAGLRSWRQRPAFATPPAG